MNFKKITKSINFGGHKLTIETGKIARQASAAVMVDLDGTTVLVTVVVEPHKEGERDFFPLRVDYQEKNYANGKIPGGFFKREGRPSEREILVARLIDRPIRPLFDKKFVREVQVVASVMSVNPEIEPDIPAMLGASAALSIAGLPFKGPMGAARVGYIDGCYILNPTQQQLTQSKLDLVVAGSEDSVLMVESEAAELSEDVMLGAVMFGHSQFKSAIKLIEELKQELAPQCDWQPPVLSTELYDAIAAEYVDKFEAAYRITDKKSRQAKLNSLKQDILAKQGQNEQDLRMCQNAIDSLESNIVRQKILRGEARIDGRNSTSVRPIDIEVGLLQRTHGSALFTRGETQALAVVTLGSARDAQITDNILGEEKVNFMLHYNFPPYSVGEIGMIGSPKRREIGHGRLAKRGLNAVIPSQEEFPYVIRVVSEITESNGSSSMASVCGGCLALMDAGVPIKSSVAGIAMGLVKQDDKFVVLTDILGDEDHLGDMDFKVAGTREGVTALQMDIKIPGITQEIMSQSLEQARNGRMHILGEMDKVLSSARNNLSSFAPRIMQMKINPEKIKDVIGKGGATIRGIIEESGAAIDINEDGVVNISSADEEASLKAKAAIERLTLDVEVEQIYTGKVVRITEFGAFVNLIPGKDGLLHISQIVNRRLEKVTDELSLGQEVKVKVISIDNQGRPKLSMKVLSENE